MPHATDPFGEVDNNWDTTRMGNRKGDHDTRIKRSRPIIERVAYYSSILLIINNYIDIIAVQKDALP